MKHRRFTSLYNSQTGTAKKVYDAVPLSEGWDAMDVLRELTRQGSTNHKIEVIGGCLGQLASVGLLKQTGARYRRVPIEAPIEPVEHLIHEAIVESVAHLQPVKAKNMNPKSLPTGTEPNILDIFTALAARAQTLEGKATVIANEAEQLRQDIETAGLDVAARLDKNSADLAQLAQLKALLKGLG